MLFAHLRSSLAFACALCRTVFFRDGCQGASVSAIVNPVSRARSSPVLGVTIIIMLLYWNGHNLFVQPASSRLFVRISLRCPLIITRYYVIRDVIVIFECRVTRYYVIRDVIVI